MSDTIRSHVTIRPGSGWAALNLRELWDYRDLMITIAVRDIKLRYRQTALGAIWVILQPLLAAGIFSFVFGKVAKLKGDGGVPYFLFAYAGLLAWNLFSSALQRANGSLLSNAQLVSKVYFPRLALPLASVVATLLDFTVALGMLAVLMPINHVMPTWNLLTLPFWLLLIMLLAIGIGLFTASLMVSYRDVAYVVPVLISFLQFASPVAYATSAIPAQMRGWYLLNPIATLVEGLRWSLLGHATLTSAGILCATLCALTAFIGGAFAFKRMERKFAMSSSTLRQKKP